MSYGAASWKFMGHISPNVVRIFSRIIPRCWFTWRRITLFRLITRFIAPHGFIDDMLAFFFLHFLYCLIFVDVGEKNKYISQRSSFASVASSISHHLLCRLVGRDKQAFAGLRLNCSVQIFVLCILRGDGGHFPAFFFSSIVIANLAIKMIFKL